MSARKILTPEQKISIIREHLIEKVAVSDLCDKHGISVVNFIQYHFDHPLEGYRRLTYMMIDENIVACSAGTVYRVLSQAGLLKRNAKRSLKQSSMNETASLLKLARGVLKHARPPE